MEEILDEIISCLKKGDNLSEADLAAILRVHNKRFFDAAKSAEPAAETAAPHEPAASAASAPAAPAGIEASGKQPQGRRFSKKHLLPAYLGIRQNNPERWRVWNLDLQTERKLLTLLQMKPRRTASGVATITVITKPWPCSGACLYCPNDARMPKSYLSDEPACQRAERNFFDPYLQVCSRLQALMHMGHPTDKVELIVLGGTWSDYPLSYQRWFVHELFRALNDADLAEDSLMPTQSTAAQKLRDCYTNLGLSSSAEDCQAFASEAQDKIFAGKLTYNQAVKQLYEGSEAWRSAAQWQDASFDAIEEQQRRNESASHRVVGLVVETRPDAVTCENLNLLRRFGCTKLQMGIQSVNERLLDANGRNMPASRIREAFEAVRLFGFKTHAHFMVNLLGATPQSDKEDYREFIGNPAFMPDEVKLYPCALVDGTRLVQEFKAGRWQPYSEDELVDVLVNDVLATPPFTRISRMIRDISAKDILVGNKKTNLRQLVDLQLAETAQKVQEIRFREIGTAQTEIGELHLDTVEYRTTVSTEFFLQWVTPKNQIAGFLRLSLPLEEAIARYGDRLPICKNEAMIREVHVYGQAALLHQVGAGAQHLGLGRQLIEQACQIAQTKGYAAVNVISAVGTREYYRGLGFADNGLYQQKKLTER